MASIGEINVIVNKHVISDQPSGNAPRLMLIFHNKLSMTQYEYIKEHLGKVLESDQPIVIEGGVEIFQLINGKWLHLDGSVELTDAPMPEKTPAKVSFREFL